MAKWSGAQNNTYARTIPLPRKIRRQIEIEYFGPPEVTANGWTRGVRIRPQRRPETSNTNQWIRNNTKTGERREDLRSQQRTDGEIRNLRPTPPCINGHGENPRLTPPPTTGPHQSPDSELRRSSRILARKSLSDTD